MSRSFADAGVACESCHGSGARQGDLPRAKERLEEALRFDSQHRRARQRLEFPRRGRGPGR